MSVRIEVLDHIAHVIIDNPPVNAVSQAVREGLLRAVSETSRRDGLLGVILTGAGHTFVAGADVTEFDKPPQAPDLPDVILAIETSRVPWLAAIQGYALGAGLEIALGCRWRIASDTASLGLPEVTLGIIPGAGGTVRTPRLIGVENAVDLVTGGRPVPASKALELGLIDGLIGNEAFRESAIHWLKDALVRELPLPVSSRPLAACESGFWDAAEARVVRAAKGNSGPIEALRSIAHASRASFENAMSHEREVFLRLRASDQAAALRHVFFAERAAPRPPELRSATPRSISSIGIVGGGTMGAGIAAAMLNAGYAVHMVERDAASAERGRVNMEAIYDADVAKGRLPAAAKAERLVRFSCADAYDAAAGCDLVIEAVFEDIDVKRAVFAELARVCREDAILATNTSYLDPQKIFEGIAHPERLIGLHFFSPAHIMKLIEIVPTPSTSDDVIATAFALARKLKKMPVRSGICDGFIGNRILKVYREQGERLLLGGATPGQIDGALRRFGMAMGPFEAQDLAGLDIAAYQRAAARARGEVPFAPVGDRLVDQGRLGRKTGGGWYDYKDGRASPDLPRAVADAIRAARADQGRQPKEWSDEAIVDAMVLPMLDEAAKIVGEGIAVRPSDVDLVKIHGYGFPRFRGGPVQYGRALGFAEAVSRLEALRAEGYAPLPSPQLHAWASEQIVPRS